MSRNNFYRANDAAQAPLCSACGVAARRSEARFCCGCGAMLDAGYLPTQFLRASYPAHRKPLAAFSSPRSIGVAKNGNGASQAALAFATYALVPYLGILFCVPAIVLGCFGLARWRRSPLIGGRSAALVGIALGFLILCGQLFLWWMIYSIPQWRWL